MIPILYEKNETVFNSNGLGRLRDCTSCVVTEERNGVYECDFDYPVTGAHYSDITCGRIIAVEHDDSSDVQPFDIVSRTNPIGGVVSFHAVHISYRQTKLTVSPKNIETLADALDALSNSTPDNPFTYSTDMSVTAHLGAADGVPKTVRSLLGGVEGSILDTYGGEYKWDKWTVQLLASRGVDRDFTVRYGVNMTDFSEELDYSGAYTHVIPYWSDGTKTVKGDAIAYGGIGYNGREECVPLDLSDKFDKKPTKAEVEEMAQRRLSSMQPILPAQTIKVEFVRISDSLEYSYLKDLQHCELCDTVKVVFPLYGMEGRFKIVKTVYDVILERFTSMELGTLSTTLAQALGITQGGSSGVMEIDHGVTTTYTSVASSGNSDVPVTFNGTFATAPDVVGVLMDVQTDADVASNTHQLVLQLKSVTTTGATFNIRNNGSATRKALVSWTAISN